MVIKGITGNILYALKLLPEAGEETNKTQKQGDGNRDRVGGKNKGERGRDR